MNLQNPVTKERFYLGLLLAAVVIVYCNSLWNGFTMDDGLYIEDNPQVTAPTARGFFAVNEVSKVFRPLTFATYAANWLVGPDHPSGFHIVNLLLHAAVTCLLYLLLQRLLECFTHGRIAALAAALLFAVHPIHTEAVSSIVGRAELLAAGFLLAAWIFHLQDRGILELLCFGCALLSKESAVVYLPLVIVGDYATAKSKPLVQYGSIAGVTAIYLGVLWKLQGGHFGTAIISKLDNPLAALPAVWRVLNATHVAWKYVGLQFYPAKLSCDYSFNEIPVYSDLRHTLPWAIGAVLSVGAWIWATAKRRTGVALAGGIYLAAFAATANILLPTGTIMGERLAYLPSAGFCLLVALSWTWLMKRQRTLAFGVLGVLVVALGVRTVVRNRDWKDNLTLYSAAVRAAPGSAKMHGNLGTAYMNLRQLDMARKELQAALQIEPELPDTLESLGLVEAMSGNYQTAGQMMEHAFYTSNRENPNYDYMAVNLAALYMQTGHVDGALDLLNREIAESPKYARAWSNRAVIRYQRGETAAARADAETALRLEPGNPQAKNVLRLLNAASRPVSGP